MAEMQSQHPNKERSEIENYPHGYETALTQELIASRTAATHAAFFLHYLKSGMSVLDCGCGSGGITLGLAQSVGPGKVIGIDQAEKEVERAQQKASEARVDNVSFRVGNINELEFSDGSFDAVFAHTVLEHIRDPLGALREMHRVLKPGGVMGIRDVDRGGDLLCPPDVLLTDCLTIYMEIWRRAGGHPNLGRRLRGFFYEIGLTGIQASAVLEVYGDASTVRFWSHIASTRCVEPDFVEQAVKQGLASRERLEEMSKAWLTWSERLDAFFAIPYCAVVGWKVQ